MSGNSVGRDEGDIDGDGLGAGEGGSLLREGKLLSVGDELDTTVGTELMLGFRLGSSLGCKIERKVRHHRMSDFHQTR